MLLFIFRATFQVVASETFHCKAGAGPPEAVISPLNTPFLVVDRQLGLPLRSIFSGLEGVPARARGLPGHGEVLQAIG